MQRAWYLIFHVILLRVFSIGFRGLSCEFEWTVSSRIELAHFKIHGIKTSWFHYIH